MQVTSSFFSVFRNLQLKNLQLVDEQKKGVSKHPLLNLLNGNYSWPSNSAPALNLTTFLAGIWIVFPVCGFLPALALLSDTEKDPKPTNATFSSFFKDSPIVATKASNAFLESAFDQLRQLIELYS